MRKLYFYALIFILFILQSCTFEPKGEEFVKVDSSGTPPDVHVNLNFATDTIYMRKEDAISFTYTLNGDKVNWAKFIINGRETEVQPNSNGTYRMPWVINDADAAIGIIPLELKIYTRSQTGSIADHIGAEGFLLSKKWTIVITDNIHLKSDIKKFEFVDGSLKIDWEMYKGVDFLSYKVYKYVDYSLNPLQLVATITSQQQNSFVDLTYHGEQSNYYILTNDNIRGASSLISGPLPAVTASNTISGDIQLKWIKPPFFKNLKGYRFSYRDPSGIMQQIGETTNSSVESYIVPSPIFGYNYEIYMSMIPLSDNYYIDAHLINFLSTKVTAAYGVSIPTYSFAQGGLAPISYLLNSTEGIIVFDHQSFTTIRKIKYNEGISQIDVSANNKYLLSLLSPPRNIYLEDLTDPAKSKKIDLSVTFPQMSQNASVSNVGTGVFANGKTAVLYDYVKESKMSEISIVNSGSSYPNKISPSGNFFYFDTYSDKDYTQHKEYFQYKDNQIYRLPANIQNGEVEIQSDYLPGNNEKLVRTLRNRVEVLDCNTWTIEKTWYFTIPNTQVYNLDLKSGKLVMRENDKLILFDVLNGTRQELITVGLSSNYQWSFFYNNGQLLWGEGKAFI